jgi:hypothetical protein
LRKPRDRMARVQVSDEVWAAYRAGLGATPVSVALGELVRREVGRKARRRASDVAGVRLALNDARELAHELGVLIARLEHAERSDRLATAHRAARYGTFTGRTDDLDPTAF